MDLIKAIFPLSFGAKEQKDLINLIITCIVVWVVCAVVGWVAGFIPILGTIVGLVLGLVGLYSFITLVLGVLVFLGVIGK